MLTYDQALAQILAQIAPLPPVDCRSRTRWAACWPKTSSAPQALPPFDNSSMDGFAVRAADISPNIPATLPVQGDIPAGALSLPALTPGTALRIMTGAPVPPGADTVVPVEDTEARAEGVTFLRARAGGPEHPAGGGGRDGGQRRVWRRAAACGPPRSAWRRSGPRLGPRPPAPARRDPQHRG